MSYILLLIGSFVSRTHLKDKSAVVTQIFGYHKKCIFISIELSIYNSTEYLSV